MQYNDTSTKTGLLQHCELLTGLGDGAITGSSTIKAQFTALLNRYLHKATSVILNSQDEWDFDDINNTDLPVGTTPFVAGQRSYTLPASLKILRIERVDFTYDGVNYYRALPIDSKEIQAGLGNDTVTDGYFAKNDPRYDMLGNTLRVYPLASSAEVASGALIRIEFSREATEFTASDTTKEPGLDEPFHPYLSIGASFEWAVANDLATKIKTLSAMLVDYEERMKVHYSTKQKDRDYTFMPLGVNYE